MSKLAFGVLVLALALAAIVLTAWVLGTRAPRAHVASLTRTLALPPHLLFAMLSEVEAYPSWRSGVRGVRRERADRYVETTRHGEIAYRILAEVRDARRVVAIDDPTLPFGGSWTFEIVPDATGTGAGSRLTITERGEVGPPLMRFVSAYLIGHERTLRQFLDDLAAATPAASGARAPTN